MNMTTTHNKTCIYQVLPASRLWVILVDVFVALLFILNHFIISSTAHNAKLPVGET